MLCGVSVCVCTCGCVRVGVYVWVCTCGCVRVGVYMWVCTCGCMYVHALCVCYVCGGGGTGDSVQEQRIATITMVILYMEFHGFQYILLYTHN